MRNRFANVIYEMGKDDPNLCLIVADISPAGSIAKFREEFPGRFINTGVAEQAMIGMAAGMALRGMRPIAYTIATFALYRPFEFIRDDLCYQNLPVGIVGVGGGVSYSTLGATHHAMEDVAIACAIPNMSVVVPCDPEEAEAATRWMVRDATGPSYLRIGRAGEPVLTAQADDPWEFGKLRTLQRGDGNVAVVCYGAIMGMAFEVAVVLRGRGLSVSVFSCHTLKPLDEMGLVRVVRKYRRVIVIEEMVPSGSLGSRIKEIAWTHGASCRIDAFSLRDEFLHCYGSQKDLLAAHGLSVAAILDAFDAGASRGRDIADV